MVTHEYAMGSNIKRIQVKLESLNNLRIRQMKKQTLVSFTGRITYTDKDGFILLPGLLEGLGMRSRLFTVVAAATIGRSRCWQKKLRSIKKTGEMDLKYGYIDGLMLRFRMIITWLHSHPRRGDPPAVASCGSIERKSS